MWSLNSFALFREQEAQTSIVVATLLLSIAVPYVYFKYNKPVQQKDGKWNTKSGFPKSLGAMPIIGDVWELAYTYAGRPLDWFDKECVAHNYNLWELTVPGRHTILVASKPGYVEDLTRNHSDKFVRVSEEKDVDMLRDFFGRSLFIVEGDEWKFQRKQASHLFTMANIRTAMETVIDEKVLQLRDILEKHIGDTEHPIRFTDIMGRYTSDVFGHMGFGVDMHQLDAYGDEIEKKNAMQAISDCADLARGRDTSFKFWWKLKRFLNVGTERQMRENLKLIEDLVKKVIQESLEHKAAMDAKKEQGDSIIEAKKGDLISLFLSSAEKRPPNGLGYYTDDMTYIRDMVLTFMSAGQDTTSQTMSWVIVMLNRHPEVATKIRQELKEQLPNELWRIDEQGKYCDLKQTPSMEQLTHLIYLEAVILETLRLYNAVSITRKTAIEDVVLHDGTHVKKGWRILLALYSMARSPEVWGENAADFIPERWMNEEEPTKIKKISPFQATAFGAGPRACLGQRFAMWQMKATLAVLLSGLKFKTIEDPWKVMYLVSLALKVKGPLEVTVSRF